jgi:hypothetical protein
MNLPNAPCAVVERSKIVDCILNPAHPENGGKAPFFFSLGFRRNEWEPLAAALLGLAESHHVAKNVVSRHGRKYIVDGRIRTPSGKAPMVRTVWIVDAGREKPRLVTAYPWEE